MVLSHQDPRKEKILSEELSIWHVFTLFVGRFYLINCSFTGACCEEKSLWMLLGCLAGVDKLSREETQCKLNVFRSPSKQSNLWSCVTCPGPPLTCSRYQCQKVGYHFQGLYKGRFPKSNSEEQCLHSQM